MEDKALRETKVLLDLKESKDQQEDQYVFPNLFLYCR